MDTTTREKYISVIFYLMTYLSNERQGIENANKLAIQYPDILEEIISSFSKNYGLSFIDMKNNEERLKYESLLGQYLSSILKQELSPSIEDEELLLKESIEISPESMPQAEFILSKDKKDIFSAQKISLSGIKSWLLNPDYVRYFKIDTNENYICTKLIHIGNVKKILFFHARSNKQYSLLKDYDIVTALILNYNNFSDMLSSPIRLFLYVLDEYGLDIELNGVIKKLFYHVKLQNNYSIQIKSKSKSQFTSWQITGTKADTKGEKEENLYFLYGIDIEAYLKNS